MKRLTALAIMMAFAALASAAIIEDNFESYQTTADLNAAWPIGGGGETDTYLDLTANGPTWPGDRCVHHTVASVRRDQTFTSFELAGGEELVWQFDYYDFVGNATDPRQYGQLLASVEAGGAGGLSQLIAMGQYNNATNHNRNKYQARVAFNSINWFNLNTDRSIGWHTFKAVIKKDASTVDFYVDGALDTADVACPAGFWYQARIGSGASSAGGAASFDNYLLEVVPEPASLLLLALGALGLRRR